MAKKNQVAAEPAEEKRDKIVQKDFTALLKVPLTDSELLEQGTLMADASKSVALLEAEFQSLKTQYKAKIEGAQAAVLRAASVIQDKFEYRNVGCTRTLNYTNATVREVRNDTGDVIAERVMNNEERQMEADLQP